MRIIHYISICFLLVLTACGGAKTVVGSATANPALTTKNIINAHKSAAQNFTTLAARMQVKYQDPEQSQSITTSLRMEKDKAIWIKASILGITLAKVLITPDQVQFYETIDGSYFVGDFRLLSDLLGTDIDFQQAQAIFLGQSIAPLTSAKFNSSITNNKYALIPKVQDPRFILQLFLNPDTFLISSEKISQPEKGNTLEVTYGPYQIVENANYPTEIYIQAIENEKTTTVEINYRKIDLNVSVNFPFQIPEGYQQKTLN